MRGGTRDVALVGVVAALSFVLYIIGTHLPNSGQYSLASVPVLVLALLRGWPLGMMAGALAGTLHYFLRYDPEPPLALLLDFTVASACLGVAGFFRAPGYPMARSVIGVAVAVLLKFCAHVLSGLIILGSAGTSALYASASFNAPPMLFQLIINIAIVPTLARRLGSFQ